MSLIVGKKLADQEDKASGRPLGKEAKLAFALYLAFFVLSASWATATPLFSAPDERAHAIKAAGTVRGQVLGKSVEGTSTTLMRVPAWLDPADQAADCYRYKPGVDAFCPRDSAVSPGLREVPARAGRYPPFYYFLVGSPTYLPDAALGLYIVRLISAALGAGFLTVSFLCALRCRSAPALPLGLAVAITPMTYYLLGSVNPNGLEVSAAICLWVTGTVLMLEGPKQHRSRTLWLLVWLAAAASTLALTRSGSPIFTALSLSTLALFGGRKRVLELARDRRLWAVTAFIGLVGAVAALMVVFSDPYPGPVETVDPRAFSARFFRSLRRQDDYALQMIGVFGALDTVAPRVVFLLWFSVAGALVAVAASQSFRRFLVIAFLCSTMILLSTIVEAMALKTMGVFWQGRYSLPLAVGIPILASGCIGRRNRMLKISLNSWSLATGVAVLAAGHLMSFTAAVRRFAGSHEGSWSALKEAPFLTFPYALSAVLLATVVAHAYLVQAPARNFLPKD